MSPSGVPSQAGVDQLHRLQLAAPAIGGDLDLDRTLRRILIV